MFPLWRRASYFCMVCEIHGIGRELPAGHLLHPETHLEFLMPVLTLAALVVFPNHHAGGFLAICGHGVIAVPGGREQIRLRIRPPQHDQPEAA